MKKGLPAVLSLGQPAKELQSAKAEDENEKRNANDGSSENDPNEATKNESDVIRSRPTPPTHDEYIWQWKASASIFSLFAVVTDLLQPDLETTRRTFFL